jgi:DNA-binding transcriptional LysR family regulator
LKLNDCIEVIGGMNFAAVDLNLLRVFDAMMVELNTTRAGERVGLSQPAISTALGRLRHITGDALFVREGNRMVPTTRARQLAGPLSSALRQVEEALSSVVRFDPATATDTFRIIGSDYFSALLMPGLVSAVREAAPGLVLQMLDYPSSEIVARLGDGTVDLALDARFETPDWICTQTLYQSFIVTAARADNPILSGAGVRPGQRIPPELFCAISQVLMSMDGSRTGTMDAALSQQGLKRRVSMTVPHFQAVALAVAEADLLGNLPVHYARRVAPLLGLELFLPPFDPPILDVMLFWHRRHDEDPAQAWLRQRISEVLAFGHPGRIELPAV